MPHIPQQGDPAPKKQEKRRGTLRLREKPLSLFEHTVDPMDVYDSLFGEEKPEDAAKRGIINVPKKK